MELAMHEVYNLHLYDKTTEESLIDLTSLQDVEIFYSDEHETYLIFAKNALLNFDVLKFLGDYKAPTSFESKLGKKQYISVLKETPRSEFKLLAETIGRHIETTKSHKVTLEFNNVEIISRAELKGVSGEVSGLDLIFKVNPLDNEFFKIHY
ncbi:hypothetical protein ACFC3I_11630 [Bacillus velezensis]|uniref:hypothetical protein n=1 Tax=Bacillati TaxID=1783272 RepID=UPI0004A80761|nr:MULTISPECIES: hypothetical protein [Bacillus]AUS16123.1 hypothetical protein C0W57_08010 [Bacillus velezensis]AWQ17027.1 hypothetical protein C1N92_20210 [Bacillus velezensis]KAF1273300.1 hypothetical protein BUE72_19925 [Bacillus amyloliquefaciens]MCO6395629.1 hypothetical protein [Bacillus velezensis]UHC66453.1 hypothetical protein K3G25_07605 [Bacillus sp. FCW2]